MKVVNVNTKIEQFLLVTPEDYLRPCSIKLSCGLLQTLAFAVACLAFAAPFLPALVELTGGETLIYALFPNSLAINFLNAALYQRFLM